MWKSQVDWAKRGRVENSRKMECNEREVLDMGTELWNYHK